MEFHTVTTPFGRRAMTLGMFRTQAEAQTLAPDAEIDKWVLFRALCEAKPALGVTDRALAVLNALLSFHPQQALRAGEGLVVFPSNVQLCRRAHGMAPTTLRRHLAALVEAGLIIRRDSPNGKRYARRNGDDAIGEAFGFCLSPLLARADEIRAMAAALEAERLALMHLRERLSLCRRDIGKLIAAAMEAELPGDWDVFYLRYRDLAAAIPRKAEADRIVECLSRAETLRSDVVKCFDLQLKPEKKNGNDGQNGLHKQNSKPNIHHESELCFEKSKSETAGAETEGEEPGGKGGEKTASPSVDDGKAAVPLGFVLRSCPSVADYGPAGAVQSWRDLMSAAVTVRSMLGVSPSAYEEACAAMGPENAASVVACILERSGQIQSAGGYLRALTARARNGTFSVKPMLHALARGRITGRGEGAARC
ncbi:plasmid replication protein RepC [Ensifer soli]|uniref:plasmid replication protein RepC n=1 Tax=Ciceribacter sp. sgz301302 TaxID=3342379 RepID=UPI0035B9E609